LRKFRLGKLHLNQEVSLDIEKIQFYKEASSRICSSLDIEKALWNLFDYLEHFIPMDGISLSLSEPDYSMKHIAYIHTKKNPAFTPTFSVPDEIKRELKSSWKMIETVRILNRAHLDPVVKAMVHLTKSPFIPFSLLIMKKEKS